jgi:hypothetical protein
MESKYIVPSILSKSNSLVCIQPSKHNLHDCRRTQTFKHFRIDVARQPKSQNQQVYANTPLCRAYSQHHQRHVVFGSTSMAHFQTIYY